MTSEWAPLNIHIYMLHVLVYTGKVALCSPGMVQCTLYQVRHTAACFTAVPRCVSSRDFR